MATHFFNGSTIFDITWPKNTQIEICLALNNPEFRELFKNGLGFDCNFQINREKY